MSRFRRWACVLVGTLVPTLPFAYAATRNAQEPFFEQAFVTTPDAAIDFVHVERDQQGEVRLDIYFKQLTKMRTWSSRTDPKLGQEEDPPTDPLASYVQSSNWKVLGVRRYNPAGQGSGITTTFEFKKGPPGVQSPVEIDGARLVELSDDGKCIVFAEPASEQDGPARVGVFKLRPNPDHQGHSFQLAKSYSTVLHGSVHLSWDGSVIAQIDRTRVKVFPSKGEMPPPDAPPDAGTGIDLDEAGIGLAIRTLSGAQFLQISDGVLQVEKGQRFETRRPALDTAFAGDWALVQTDSSVHLREWKVEGNPNDRWSRDYPAGTVASIHLIHLDDETLAAAIGYLEVVSAPRRVNGQHVWGEGIGHVDVVILQPRDTADVVKEERTHSFDTKRWTHDEPRVRILEESRRVIVRSSDAVLVSQPLVN